MDGIQPFAGANRPLVATVHTSAPSPSTVKTPSDYLRAVRRRVWLVLAVAIPVATVGTLLVLRLPPVYQVSATIEIKPPQVDPTVFQLVGGNRGAGPAIDEKYIPNTLAILNGKNLADQVLRDPALGLPASALEGDAALELMTKVKSRQIPQSNFFIVTLEGRDPDRITRTLNRMLTLFANKTNTESRDLGESAKLQVSTSMKKFADELETNQKDITAHIKTSKSLAPGGKNLAEARYETLRQQYFYKQDRATNLQQSALIESARPVTPAVVNASKVAKLQELEAAKKNHKKRLDRFVKIAVDSSDPSIRHAKESLAEVEADIAALQADAPPASEGVSTADVYSQILEGAIAGIHSTEEELTTALVDLMDAMPEQQKYLMLMKEQDLKSRQLADLREKMAEFTMLEAAKNAPVTFREEATEPTAPKSPNRAAYIAVFVLLSLGLGLGLVCFLEHIDHSVKVPEHLTAGLGLPLFGVVPRMLRNARNHRGGHLWTPGTPDSIEADAYRNLRASLLGVTTEKRPIVTLLVTSAKAGEGKSTTALNLAATCARAGERTLLMDVDLRRPSLGGVFPGCEGGTGLVDVLRGDLPWQRTVVQTDLPNLDFLPTGDTRDVPIEVLGSLELRQLLLSLSEHHYDRVILDGPAVLGLADCRMLGRIVDAAMLVVRSGSQELRPLQRAKSMLEQSQVHIAGLVFNGLNEDLQNWSSYGPNPLLDSSADFANARAAGSSRGLGSRPNRAAALMAAGPVEA